MKNQNSTPVKPHSNSFRKAIAAIVAIIGLSAAAAYSLGVSAESIRHFMLSAVGSAELTSEQSFVQQPRMQGALSPSAPALTGSNLLAARSGHTATGLNDGRILITGGDAGGTSEIFDPVAGISVSTGNLNAARAGHTATKLADGRVLITGGSVSGASVASTEIYDPSTGTFGVGPSMNSARSGQTATTLSDGRILITGGDAGGSAEIYDPSANSFTSVSAAMASARSGHSAARLNDGNVLIVGGTAPDSSPVQTGEIFDVASSTFSAVGNSTADPHVHALLRVLPDGKVQIIGGTDHGDIEIYDPAINQFGAHSHVFPSGDIHPELVQQILDSPTRAALFYHGAPDALRNREGHTITEIPGSNQAFVAGGTDSSNTVLSSASVLNSSPASITTDKLDYAPGTPVVVTGTGFQPGETVTLMFHEDPHPVTENPHTFTVTTDVNGNFTDQQYAPEDGDADVAYILAAIGGTSGWTAQTAFTDGPTPDYTASINPTSALLGNSVSYTITVTNLPTSGQDIGSVEVTIPSGAGTPSSVTVTATDPGPTSRTWIISTTTPTLRFSRSGASTNDIDPSGTITITFNATAATPGSKVWTTTAFKNNNFTSAGVLTGTQPTVNILASTTTVVTSSANPSVYGQSVTFTGTVTSGSGTPTGTVTFKDGATTLGTGTLNGSGQATFSTSSLSVGSHSITAEYAGAGIFNNSTSSALLQVVNKASTTTTITSDHLNPLSWTQILPTGTGPSLSTCGQSTVPDGNGRLIVYARTVCGGGSGEVWVLNGANGNGTPSWSLVSNTGPSRHAQTVVYDAASNKLILFGGCSGGCTPVTNDVWVLTNANGQGGAAVWTQLTTTGGPPAARDHAAGAYDPASNRLIIFGGQDGGGGVIGETFADVWVLTNANVTSGTHTWTKLSTTGIFPTGQYQARAFYDSVNNRLTVAGGARSDTGNASNAVNVLTNANGIGGTPAWTNLIAENAVGAPAFAGWPADYNVGANRGILAETGTPNLYYLNNANGLGGTTSYTHITPSSGAGVTPTWGLAYDSPSDRTMTWYQSGSNLSYYLAPASSSIFGQSVTFTANVNVIAPGAGSPTGTIQFFDGVTPIGGAQPVLGGAASVSTSSLVVNVHNITAAYNGDASFTTSTSSPLSHTVTQAATTTTVTSSANPSTYGDSVTFTSTTVNGITPVNEGTVTFIEGATCASPTTILQAATLVGTSGPNTGKATFTTSALTVPSHTVTACYAGTNFATSNGNVTQTVNPANQTISVTTPAPANAVFGTNFNVAATGGASGNAVTIASSGACSGSGNNSATITMTSGTGTCTVTYNQAGNSNYNAAPQVTSNTTAAKATQTITFNALAGKIYGDASFGVSATASSGLVVSFSSDTATVCSLTGSTVSILAAGTCTVRALQAGNGNYSAATDVTQSFTVGQKTLTPSISAGNKVYDGNTSATFTCSLAGVVGLDDVSCTGGTAVFADKNKGTGKTVTATGLALSGTKAANYSLSPTSASTTADITARPITVTATTNTKVFDGTTSAAAVPTFTLGTLAGTDTATLSETYTDANAGTNKTLVPAASISDGNGGNNYAVTPVNNTTGVINPRSTTTIVSLTSGTNPSIFGDSLTFAASVAGSGSGAGNPTGGSVQFKVDGSNFGSPVALSAGLASFSTSSLNAGNHTISGVFTSGDANFNGSTSNNLSQDVNKANQTINFAALADMTFGDADFGVSAMASSGLAVSFSASGNCTVTGSTVHITSAGSCTITASQAGNANYNAATSVSQTFTINHAGTTTAIASTSNPSVVGELVTFTAAITQTQGGEVPTGIVTFKDGATTIGTGTLNGSAQASFTTSQLALGSHSITAVYGGDTNYSTSTSPILVQVVSKASTSSSLVNWSQLSPTGGGPSVNTCGQNTVSDNQGRLIVFARTNCGFGGDEVWVLDGANGIGSPVWTKLVTTGGPPTARNSGTGVYDPVGNNLIIFGGCDDGCGTSLGDTWVLSHANGQGGSSVWSQVSAGGGPAGRNNAVGAYDPATNRLMIFGGVGSLGSIPGNNFPDVWVLTNANGSGGSAVWSQVVTAGTFPLGVWLPSISYDSANNRLTVAGGGRSDTGAASNAVNVLTNANGTGGTPTWTNSIPEGTAGAPAFAATQSTYDAANNRTFIAEQSTSNIHVLANTNGLGGAASYSAVSPRHGVSAGVPTYGLALDGPTGILMSYYVSGGTDLSYVLAPSIADSSTFGDSVTFTAKVDVTAPGSGSTTGTATFKDGAATIGTGTVTGGVATFTTSGLNAGLHNITVMYGGDGNFNSSTSGVLAHTVNKAPTTTSVMSSVNPSTYGQSVTFTATVLNGSTPVTEGTVTFIEGDTCALPTITLQAASAVNGSGQVVFTTNSLTAGIHPVNACYTGTNFADSTGGGNQTVNKATLMPHITASNKIYDGNTTATLLTQTLTTILFSDDVTLNVGAADFDTKNVGTNKTVTANGLTLSGTTAGNYQLSSTMATTMANITTRSITVTAITNSKVYDGTTSAAAIPAVTVGTIALGDTANFTESYDTKNAGTGKTLTPSGSVTDGNSGNNYAVTFQNNTTGVITAKPITVAAAGVNRVYDGTTNATVTLSIPTGIVSGDFVTPAYTSASFSDKNVGNGKTVSVSDISLTGLDSGNYSANTTATAAANITPRTLTVTATGVNKIYNGTTMATVNLSDDRVSGDLLTVAYASASFANKNVGNGKSISVTAISIAGGADQGNYSLGNTTATASADITPRTLSITATGVNKTYDGNTTATVTLQDDRVAGDVFTASYTSASFATKTVANGKTVTVNSISITGADAGNYNANTSTTTTADITPRTLTVTATGIDRVYDATTAASVTLGDDRVSGDDVTTTYISASFANKNVGTNKPVNVAGISITGGTDALNYVLGNTTASTTASVSQRPLTVTASGVDKEYDGNATAAVTLSTNKLGSDNVTATYTSAVFNDKTVAVSKPVSVSGISISGTDSLNYSLSNTTAATTATITAKPLTISATGVNKTYDGNATATVNLSIAGTVSGDIVMAAYTSASFADKNVGSGKPVSVTGITISGGDAGNYTYNATASTAADISALAITIKAVTDTRTYNGNASSAQAPLFETLVGTDTGTAVQVFNSRNAGPQTLSVSSYSINDGNSGGNYSVATQTAAGSINPLAITVTAVTDTREYDGSTNSAGSPSIVPALVGGDTSGFGQSYDNRNAGSSKTLTPFGSANDGNSGNNYAVSLVAVHTGAITQRPITIAAVADTKIYDANTNSTGTPVVALGSIVSPDTGNFTQAFVSANAGTSKTIVPSGSVNDGNVGNNYNITFESNTNGVINKANPVISVTPYNAVFDGAAHTATGTAKGVLGEALAGLDLSTTTHTNAGGYPTDPWTFNDVTGNYNNTNGTTADNIDKASSLTAVTCPTSVVYNSMPQTPCTVSVTGAGGLTLTPAPSYANNTDAGTATASYTYAGDANHNGSSDSKNFTIDKAGSTTVVTFEAGPYVYRATPFTATATVTGVGGLNQAVTVIYSGDCTNVTVAGGCTASATFAGDANHNNSTDSKIITITKADAVVIVNGYSGTYDATAHGATGSATGIAGVNLAASLNLGNVFTNAPGGTAHWIFTGGQNYNDQSGDASINIGKAPSSVTVTCSPLSVVYTGSAQTPCNASYSGVGGISGSLTSSYLNNINPGFASASASYGGDSNHDPSSNTANFTITNNAVANLAVSSAVINENSTATLTISFSDADLSQSHTAIVNWGDGSGPQPPIMIPARTYSITVSRTFLDDDPTDTPYDVKNVSVTVTDGDSTATGGSTVTINNVAPTITSILGAPTAPVQINIPVSLTAGFADAGKQDSHTCSFNWDDTTPSAFVGGDVTETIGSGVGTCTGSKTFTVPGVYTILVSVKDDDTGVVTQGLDTQYVVVFDPNGGFVTGGGWIMSPTGACKLAGCSDGTVGKANFGFVSKYKKGTNIPDGQTEFQFQAGNLNFHSSSYDPGSLVVQGYKAQYKGTGDINGQSGYKFVLTAYDGDVSGGGGVDKFRMKIIRTADNIVVYDNRMNGSDDIDLADPMAISGGSINIQKAGK